jgi:hypothetical protein
MNTLPKNEDANGGIFGAMLVFIVIIVFGVFGGLVLQTANDGYTVDNNTTMGKTSESNDNIIGMIWNMWPVAAILGFLLLCGVLAAAALNGGSHFGRG